MWIPIIIHATYSQTDPNNITVFIEGSRLLQERMKCVDGALQSQLLSIEEVTQQNVN